MKLFILPALCALAIETFAGAIPAAGQVSPVELQEVQRLSDIYHLDGASASRNYRKMFDSDFLSSLHALDYFKDNHAYEVIALALPRLPDSTKGTATEVLLKKRDFSPTAFKALLSELNARVVSETADDEERSGNEVMRREISAVLARWLSIPEPKITSEIRVSSQPEYVAFIAQARQKAETIKSSSPY
jgi:hypothetical protein